MIHAEDFVVKKGSVDVSSAGTVKVNASDELSAEAGSGSSVFYKGEPSITHQDISKSGTLKKM